LILFSFLFIYYHCFVVVSQLKPTKGHYKRQCHFLDFSLGEGKVIADGHDQSQQIVQIQKLNSPDILALNGLGQFQQFEVAGELRRFIENWHLSDFQRSEARKINSASGYDEHLSRNADNLALFAQFMSKHYPETYQDIMHKMRQRVPSISSVEPI